MVYVATGIQAQITVSAKAGEARLKPVTHLVDPGRLTKFKLPLTRALREGRPAHDEFTVRSADGVKHRIAASAMPIVGAASGASGAMVIFWPVDEKQAREVTTGRPEVAS